MITKGIIKKVEGYKAVVSIPALGQSDMNLNLDTSSLPKAQVMSQPGMSPVYNVGDVVYIALEDNNIFKPVILGILPATSSSKSDFDIGELVANVSASLPSSTKIGSIHMDELIAALSDTFFSLSEVCERIVSLEVTDDIN